ncbi:hypothetical protein [Paenibacillus eucommiae]|uniref:Gfo/Idh/MocA-like oxidoreductase N-terminal domain-containing protein n=1 Tax=Paenibacillus eucommiae TaxID=1355755 RepID=A0ABS4J1R1_9BACL|nr:hypothetical protein [Paenibacillus eucommiae]MBP1993196.1 hypothetical protein [Paenibacillus eucommiae]
MLIKIMGAGTTRYGIEYSINWRRCNRRLSFTALSKRAGFNAIAIADINLSKSEQLAQKSAAPTINI